MENFKVYLIRWLLLVIICITTLTRTFVSRTFVSINSVLGGYFHVNLYAIDILATVDTLTAMPICFMFALFGTRFGLRRQMMTTAICTFLGTAACTTGFLRRDRYLLVLCGRLLMGIPQAFVYITPCMLADSWFPEKELVIVTSLTMFSFIVGGATSGTTPYFYDNVQNLTFDTTTFGNRSFESAEFEDAQHKLVLCFTVLSIFMLLAVILSFEYAEDHAPTPPRATQAYKRELGTASNDLSLRKTFHESVSEITKLLRIPQFVMLTVSNFLKTSMYYITIVAPSFLLLTFPDLGIKYQGFLLALTFPVAGIGYFIACRVLDKFKSFKLTLVIGNIAIILSCIWITLSHKYNFLISLFIGYPFAFGFHFFSSTALIEFTTEISYSCSKMTMFAIFYGFQNAAIFTFSLIIRWVQQISNETIASLVMTPINVLALILILLAKPDYKRTAVENQQDADEKSKLIK